MKQVKSKEKIRIQCYFNGKHDEVVYREILHESGFLAVYTEQDFYAITTLSGYGVASNFRCLSTAKAVCEELAALDGWDGSINFVIKRHAETSRKYSNAADFANMWSTTAEEFAEKFKSIIQHDIL